MKSESAVNNYGYSSFGQLIGQKGQLMDLFGELKSQKFRCNRCRLKMASLKVHPISVTTLVDGLSEEMSRLEYDDPRLEQLGVECRDGWHRGIVSTWEQKSVRNQFAESVQPDSVAVYGYPGGFPNLENLKRAYHIGGVTLANEGLEFRGW